MNNTCFQYLNHVTDIIDRGHYSVSTLTKTLAKVCLFVYEDFGWYDSTERYEGLHQILVTEFLGEMVDEQVGSVRPCNRGY